VKGDEMLCSHCGSIVNYDENFHNLICPKCNRKFTFTDIRRKITMEYEQNENFIAKQLAYKLTKPLQEIEEKDESDKEEKSSLYRNISADKEDNEMRKDEKCKHDNDEELFDESYYQTLDMFKDMHKTSSVCDGPANTNVISEALEESKIHLAHDPEKIITDTQALIDEDTPHDTLCKNDSEKSIDVCENKDERQNESSHKVIVDNTVKVTEIQDGEVISETEKQSTVVVKQEPSQYIINSGKKDTTCEPNVKYPDVTNKTSSIKVVLSDDDDKQNNTVDKCNDGFSDVEVTDFDADKTDEKELTRDYEISTTVEMPVPVGDHVDSYTEKKVDPIEQLRNELRNDIEVADTTNLIDAEDYEKLYDQNDKEKKNPRGGTSRKRWDD
jgi:predicted RNA-binding Zn-ribbon protein involved in translation (DUF1610 family)